MCHREPQIPEQYVVFLTYIKQLRPALHAPDIMRNNRNGGKSR
jgi:hypothetical protein